MHGLGELELLFVYRNTI